MKPTSKKGGLLLFLMLLLSICRNTNEGTEVLTFPSNAVDAESDTEHY